MIVSGIFAGFALLSTLTTGLVLRWLRAKHILDIPNDRSSHHIPTPRGGGLAVTPLIVLGFSGWYALHGASIAEWVMILAAAGLALMSWIDDRRTLSALPRFAIQILAVATVLICMPSVHITQGLLPSFVEKIALGFAWVWFINLFNFMDGIDGITGTETACIAVGLFIAIPGAVPAPLLAIIAATAVGFLVWNWYPAKIFMGDVGSIPLGFILGYLLISAAATQPHGWAVALILPALYWADATITLIRRGIAKKPIWKAHREHFYQKANQGGWSHAQVSLILLIGNLALIGLARLALYIHPLIAIIAAIIATSMVLGLFQMKFHKKNNH